MATKPKQPSLIRVKSGKPDLDRWLQQATELLETFHGRRGDALDRALTVRDITPDGANGTRTLESLRSVVGREDTTLAEVITPTALSNLSTVSGLGSLFLSWDGTNMNGYSHTELWRHTVDNLADATKIATSIVPLYVDYVGGGTQYFYWVRAVSTSGTPGPYNQTAGTPGTAALDPSYVLNVLQGSITSSQLLANLRAEIDRIPILAAASGNQLLDPDFKLTAAADDATFWNFNGTTRVWDGTGGTSGPTAIINVTNGSTNALQSSTGYQASPGDTVYIKFNFRVTAGYDGGYITARAVAYNAGETLSANYSVDIPVTDAGNIETADVSVVLGASYTDHYRIEFYPHPFATNGHNLKLENLYAGIVPQNMYAFIEAESITRAEGDAALAQDISTMGIAVSGNTGAIQSEATLRINGDDALAQDINALGLTVGDNTLAVQTEASARADADGLLNAEYTIKVNANGHVAGMGVAVSGGASGVITSEIIMLADKFAIVTPGALLGEIPNIPFIVGNVNGVPTVGVDGQLVVDGSITANHIAAGEIYGTHLFGDTLSVLKGDLGEINAGTFRTADDPAWRTEISSVGNLPVWYGAGVKAEATGRFYLKNDGSMVIRDHNSAVIMQTFASDAPVYNTQLDNNQQQYDAIQGAKPPSNADATDYTDVRVSNSIEEGSVTTIAAPAGGRYSGSGDVTGAIIITLPQSWTDTMMKMEIDIFLYEANKSFTVACGGYAYGVGASWINEFAQIMGSTASDNRVRFGHNGTKCCIIIGETTTVWKYPKIAVRNFQAGHSNRTTAQWSTGWAVTISTSLAGYATPTGDFSNALLDAKSILGQGAFATVDQITPANASTYIADLAVDTLQIAENAATVPVSATSSHVTVPHSAESVSVFSGGVPTWSVWTKIDEMFLTYPTSAVNQPTYVNANFIVTNAANSYTLTPLGYQTYQRALAWAGHGNDNETGDYIPSSEWPARLVMGLRVFNVTTQQYTGFYQFNTAWGDGVMAGNSLTMVFNAATAHQFRIETWAVGTHMEANPKVRTTMYAILTQR